jgi:hypothetical protein
MRRYVLLAAVALALACDRGRTTDCTLIGCQSELTVEIQNAPPGPITVQAIVPNGSDTVHTAACPGDTGCTSTVSFAAFAPVHVHLTVTTTAGTRRWDVRPRYGTMQPNGPRCPDICRYGTVRLTWQ